MKTKQKLFLKIYLTQLNNSTNNVQINWHLGAVERTERLWVWIPVVAGFRG